MAKGFDDEKKETTSARCQDWVSLYHSFKFFHHFSFGRRGRGLFGEEHRLLGVRYKRVVEVRNRALCVGELVTS